MLTNSRFLLAHLYLASFTDKTTKREIKRALKNLQKGSEALDNAYTTVLERILSQGDGLRNLGAGLDEGKWLCRSRGRTGWTALARWSTM
jgi:hypothetical protein